MRTSSTCEIRRWLRIVGAILAGQNAQPPTRSVPGSLLRDPEYRSLRLNGAAPDGDAGLASFQALGLMFWLRAF
jgi:hypothetical protein